MKIAYVAVEKVSGNHGVPKKFAYQIAAWREAGATCEFFGAAEDFDSQNSLVNGTILLRKKYDNPLKQWKEDRWVLGKLVASLRDWAPDLVYLRWGYHKPEYLTIADEFPTVLELNGDILATAKMSAREKKGLRKILGLYVQATLPPLFSRVAGFVAVTNEVAKLPYVARHRKPVGVFANSIQLDEYAIQPFRGDESAVPRVVFIGNVASWHGLDKVVELAKATQGRLEIDIIGCAKGDDEVVSNLTYHGYLDRESYLEVFSRASVGLDGVALYRKKMNEACPLKIREYLASGLPIILSAEDTAFMGEDRGWILRIGNDPKNLIRSIDEIVEFSKKMKGYRVPHSETYQFINSIKVEGRKIKFFESILNT